MVIGLSTSEMYSDTCHPRRYAKFIVIRRLLVGYGGVISCFILYLMWSTVFTGNLAYPEAEENQEKVLDNLEQGMIQGTTRMERHYTTRHLHFPDTRLLPVLPPD